MEIALEDTGIVGPWIEVDTDREIAQVMQCPHLGSDPGGETEHVVRFSQGSTVSEAPPELCKVCFIGLVQPILDLAQLACLMLKIVVVRGIGALRHVFVALPGFGFEGGSPCCVPGDSLALPGPFAHPEAGNISEASQEPSNPTRGSGGGPGLG